MATSATRTIRFAVLALLIVAMGSVVSACGRKGAPEVPPGSTYPGSYPGN